MELNVFLLFLENNNHPLLLDKVPAIQLDRMHRHYNTSNWKSIHSGKCEYYFPDPEILSSHDDARVDSKLQQKKIK